MHMYILSGTDLPSSIRYRKAIHYWTGTQPHPRCTTVAYPATPPPSATTRWWPSTSPPRPSSPRPRSSPTTSTTCWATWAASWASCSATACCPASTRAESMPRRRNIRWRFLCGEMRLFESFVSQWICKFRRGQKLSVSRTLSRDLRDLLALYTFRFLHWK